MDRPQVRHRLGLGVILLAGFFLRLWALESKPLWLDEVITALLSAGRSMADVPLDVLFPLSAVEALFQPLPHVSFGEIAGRVSQESTHPPLFFGLMYYWMNSVQPGEHWVGALRFPAVVFGTGAIAAVYWLTRLVVSAQAGLIAAGLMAVSPFAVYLSQEARHYTLPMLWITLALAALVQMQQDLHYGGFQRQALRSWVWGGWIGLNLLALYTHYFSLLALVAQVGAIALWLGWEDWQKRRVQLWRWGAIALAVGGVGLGYLPWLAVMVQHLHRPETDWLTRQPDWGERLQYLVQLAVNGVVMGVIFPVEQQPWRIAVPAAVLMLGITAWMIGQMVRGALRLWPQRAHYPGLALLLGYGLILLLEFLGIIYGMNRNITAAPRYNFLVYPVVCALGAIALWALPVSSRRWPARRGVVVTAVLVGLISSIFVTQNLAFQKPYRPEEVAQRMVGQAETPMILLSSYQSLQDIALGLSFALEIDRLYPQQAHLLPSTSPPVELGFMFRPAGGYRPVWNQLEQSQTSLTPPLALWAIATPGMRTENYPDLLRLQTATAPPESLRCEINPEGYYRTGVPYQQFQCR